MLLDTSEEQGFFTLQLERKCERSRVAGMALECLISKVLAKQKGPADPDLEADCRHEVSAAFWAVTLFLSIVGVLWTQSDPDMRLGALESPSRVGYGAVNNFCPILGRFLQ